MTSHNFLFKKAIKERKKTNKKVLLFHAASNGELEQIKPIFRIIDREQYFIFLTISSPSAFNHIPKNEIWLNNLSYKYVGSSFLSVKDVNAKIPINSIVAFVGHIGSGKSTII